MRAWRIILAAVLLAGSAVVDTAVAAVECRGAPATIEGTPGADSLNGTPGPDVIAGLGGDDILTGFDGVDLLCGGDGNDTIHAYGDADQVDGGAGVDTASYETSTRGVIAHLGGAGGLGRALEFADVADTLRNVENLIGTQTDDQLAGGPGRNRVEGGPGDDSFAFYLGDTGEDEWIGGPGTDGAAFGRSTAPLTLDVAAGTALLGGSVQKRTRLTEIEVFSGTVFEDTMTGGPVSDTFSGGPGDVPSGEKNTLSGLGGDDSLTSTPGGGQIDGGDGDDRITAPLGFRPVTAMGGAGNDRLSGTGGEWYPITHSFAGGLGNDLIIGSSLNDQISGDAGEDDMSGQSGDDVLDGGSGESDAASGGLGSDLCTAVEFPGSDCASQDGGDTYIGPVPAVGPEADLSVRVRDLRSDRRLTSAFGVTVTNAGPRAATRVQMRFVPEGRVVAIESDHAECHRGFGGLIAAEIDYFNSDGNCVFETLASGTSRTVRVEVNMTRDGQTGHLAYVFDHYPIGNDAIARDPNWGNNVAVVGEEVTCPLEQPALEQVQLERRELVELVRDQRGNLSQVEWTERVNEAIEVIEADTAAHPERQAENDRLIAELRALIEASTRTRRMIAQSAAEEDPLTQRQEEILDAAACGVLSEAKDHLKEYLTFENKADAAVLVDQLDTLREILYNYYQGEDVSNSKADEYLQGAVEALVSRLAKDKLDENATERASKRYAAVAVNIYRVIREYRFSDMTVEQTKELFKSALKDAASAFGGKDFGELVKLSISLRDVIAGDATEEQQYEILKETVANLANRLTTRLFGTAILTTPQARAAMLGFELGLAFGNRIANDLELIFTGSLIDDCTQTLASAQGGSGTIDVRYNEPTRAFVTNELLWHHGWECVILTQGYLNSRAGGIVQATRPEDYSLSQAIVWRITTRGRGGIIYWDPACRVAGGCSYGGES